MNTEFPTPLSQAAFRKEKKAYHELDQLIDKVEANPSASLASELKDNEQSARTYSRLMADWLGVEVASLYATPDDYEWAVEPKRRPIEFLYEAVSEAVDLPMYWVRFSEGENNEHFRSQRIEDTDVKDRRNKQDEKRRSPSQQLTAELCARHLQKNDSPPCLLIPFGEILAYSFLYHVLDGLPINGSLESTSWSTIGQQAWNKLHQAHLKRPNSTQEQVTFLLLSTTTEWYSHGAMRVERAFLGADRISAIYFLDADVCTLLKTVDWRASTGNPDFARFLALWAQSLYDSIHVLSGDRGAKESFWDRTLINPEIEELLCTRGLYATIISSPFTRKPAALSHNIQAYAICTLFDANRIESNELLRAHLDSVLRRIGHEDLARYHFQRVERTDESQDRIIRLLTTVSNPSCGWPELMQEAANVTLRLGNATGVIIAWPEIGATVMLRGEKADDRARWFGYLAPFSAVINRLSGMLPSQIPPGGLSDTDYKRIQPILRRLGLEHWEQGKIGALSFGERFGERRGTFVILFDPKSQPLLSEIEQVGRIALALGVGMEMPFRSADRGLLSWVIGVIRHPLEAMRRAWSLLKRLRDRLQHRNNDIEPDQRKAEMHRVLERSIASIVEFTRVGFVAIGALFLCSMFSILFYTLCHLFPSVDHMCRVACPFLYPFGEQDAATHIVDTVRNIEHTVMAFSICLAATGVIFLLRPDFAANQPPELRTFQQLGTLERTLIRLAAMVLTIDALAVVLNAAPPKPQKNLPSLISFDQLKATAFHVSVYLLVLVGLAFISKFLLDDERRIMQRRRARGQSRHIANSTRENQHAEL